MAIREEQRVVSPSPSPRESSGVVIRHDDETSNHETNNVKPRLMESQPLPSSHNKLRTEYSPHTTGYIFRCPEFDLENSTTSRSHDSNSSQSATSTSPHNIPSPTATTRMANSRASGGEDDSKKRSSSGMTMSLDYSDDTGFTSFDFERLSMQTSKSLEDGWLWMRSSSHDDDDDDDNDESLNLSAAFPSPTNQKKANQKEVSHQTSATFLDSPLTLFGGQDGDGDDDDYSFSLSSSRNTSQRTFNSSFIKDSIIASPASSSPRPRTRRGGRRRQRQEDVPSPLSHATSSSIGKIIVSVPPFVVSPEPPKTDTTTTTASMMKAQSDRYCALHINPLSPAPEGRPKWKSAQDLYSTSKQGQQGEDGLNEISRILLRRRQQRVLEDELQREAKKQQQQQRLRQTSRRPSRRPSSSSPLRRRISSASSTGGVIAPNQAQAAAPSSSRRPPREHHHYHRPTTSLSPVRSSRQGGGNHSDDFLSSNLPMSFMSATTTTTASSAPTTPDQILKRVENGSFRLPPPLSSSPNSTTTANDDGEKNNHAPTKQVLTVLPNNRQSNAVPIPPLPQIQKSSFPSPSSKAPPPRLPPPPPRDNHNTNTTTKTVVEEPESHKVVAEPIRHGINNKEATATTSLKYSGTIPVVAEESLTPSAAGGAKERRSRSRKPRSGKRRPRRVLLSSATKAPLSTLEELLALTKNGNEHQSSSKLQQDHDSNRRPQSPRRQEDHGSNRRSHSPRRHQEHGSNRRSHSPHKKRSTRSRSGRHRKSRTPSPEKKIIDATTLQSPRRTPSPHHRRKPESPSSSSRSHHHRKSLKEKKSTKRPSASMSPRSNRSGHKNKSSRSKSPRAGKSSTVTSSPRRSLAQSLKDLQTLDHVEKPTLPLHLVPSLSSGGDDSTTEPTLPSTLTGPSSHTLRKKDPRTTVTQSPWSPHHNEKEKSATTHHSRAERLSGDHWDMGKSTFTLDEWSASEKK